MNPGPANAAADTRASFINDAWGGIAAMLVALPAAIAYGVAAYGGLGPDYVAYGVRAGLVGAVALGIVAAIVGGASNLITGPSAPAAAVLASLVATLTAGSTPVSPEHVIALVTAIVVLAGVLQALYGALGGGRLIKYIPFPVVAGYLSAVAVMIALGQIPKLLGVNGAAATALMAPSLWQWPCLIVGAVTIAVMVVAPRVTQAIPAAILALLSGAGTYLALAVFRPQLLTLTDNPMLLGTIPAAESPLHGIALSFRSLLRLEPADLHRLVVSALTLSILLSVDTLKTCVVVDALTFRRHNSNRTLFGQGLANLVSTLAGGMPGSGAIGATMVNLESGGRTRLAGALEGVAVLVVVLLFGRWIAWVPHAALAGILIVVAWRMFDWSSFHLLRQPSTVLDFVVVATVVIVAVFTNLIAAAGAGVALAMLLFIRDHIRGSVIRRTANGTAISSKQHRLPSEQAVLEQYGREIIVCELQGSLFFGTTDQLFRELEPKLTSCRFLILDLRRVQSLDFTTTHLFEQFEAMLGDHDGWLLFSRLPARRELRDYFSAHGATDRHRNTRVFETLDDALQWAEDQVLDRHLPARSDASAPLELGEFDLLQDASEDETLAALAACVTRRSVAAGEPVFQSGDRSDELYLIRSGVVRVTLSLNGRGYHTLASFGRGNFFGEMAFLVGGARSANAIATTPVELYVVSRNAFDRVTSAHPQVGVKIFARMARVLAQRLRRTDIEVRSFYDT